ncbi:Elongator complex protein 5 [Rhynchospora pubera]|uniref:Elongator complex protein 5 n=1 Tax=Rhynchospora pubera TaxID=906938 RepID=A0AAV8CLQ7_9POAL|nr:Elongator complex protein 5 [Rhynchospora pubera]
MAEGLIVRSLRDGSLPGEHAPALCLEDSLPSPLASHSHAVFRHLLTSLLSTGTGTAVVLVAFHRSPSFYLSLLSPTFHNSIRLLDCYSDPLAWKPNHHPPPPSHSPQNITLLTNLNHLPHFLSSILHLAKDLGAQGHERVTVAIDSVTHMLRHAPLPSVLQLLTNLRCHEKISSLFWLIHTDLHEPKVISSFEYISTMIASLQPIVQLPDYANANISASITSLEENYSKAKFNLRLKRRNGRVKLLCEELLIEQGSVKFSSVPSVSSVVAQNLIPKVQFNIQLSDKERMDRANVVLPFEHQGNGQNIEIYDGRRSLSESQNDPSSIKIGGLSEQKRSNNNKSEKGEIHYIRDSDDEQPDSDEDPDDDLDI